MNVSLQRKMGKRKVKGQAFAAFSHDTSRLYTRGLNSLHATQRVRPLKAMCFIIFAKGTPRATCKNYIWQFMVFGINNYLNS
jgi:hypothetical protein